MSTGGKVGIAVGVVLGLGALISLLIFCFRRKRKQAAAERLEDEKSFVGVGPVSGISRSASTRSTKTGSTAPRLNLRPVTQFSPNLDAQNANAIAMTPINEKTETKSAWERPSTSASQDVHNPFGNHAEIQQAGAPVVATGPGGPHSITPYAAPVAAAGLAAGAGAVATAANAQNNNTIGLARGASKRENRPQQLDLTKPTPEMPTPSNVPGSAGSAAIVAAGGPQNSTVHRVQLDFKPSMEDELELKAGQLIRKLMEYDDGLFHLPKTTNTRLTFPRMVSLHSPRSIRARCRSKNLSLLPSRQTPSTISTTRPTTIKRLPWWSSQTWLGPKQPQQQG